MSMLKLETRPTSLPRLAKILLGAVVGTCLLMVGVAEIAGRWQLSEYDDGRLYLSLAPGASEYYFDASAVTPKRERPALSSGLTEPRTDLSPQPEDWR